MEEVKKKEYGLLFYDVPQKEMNLYFKMKRVITRTCLPVNLSVYAFDWGLRDLLDNKFKDIGAYSRANIQMIKFDNQTQAQIEEIAYKQLDGIFATIQNSMKEAIAKLGSDGDKKEEYLDRIIRKIKDYDGLVTLYSISGRGALS